MTAPETHRLYGRAKGQKLRARPTALMDQLYPRLAVNLDALAAPPQPLALEIGFGKGEHLVAQALAMPQTSFIGCEPFLNGMAACLGLIEDNNLSNIQLYRGNALDVVDRLPDGCLERVYLLHPDPWPKLRHAKRRFVNPGPISALARVLKPGGELRLATDHPVYMAWALEVMQNQPAFAWVAEQPADWQNRPSDWPATRYGEWAVSEGRPIWYLRWTRN
jgi:tRNA (guanine-N7-)-methyltransferase